MSKVWEQDVPPSQLLDDYTSKEYNEIISYRLMPRPAEPWPDHIICLVYGKMCLVQWLFKIAGMAEAMVVMPGFIVMPIALCSTFVTFLLNFILPLS